MAAPSEPANSEQRGDNSVAPLPPVAETSASLEISAPMLDVHAPHAGIHTWSEFLIHIATIVIGLLIAVGLEQTVEYFHRMEPSDQAASTTVGESNAPLSGPQQPPN